MYDTSIIYFSTAAKNVRGYITRKSNLGAGNHFVTHFQILSDEVRLEKGFESYYRFATLTGVHQGGLIRLAKYWIKMEKF